MKHDEAVARLVEAGWHVDYQNAGGTVLSKMQSKIKSIIIWQEEADLPGIGKQERAERNQLCVSGALMESVMEICP